MGAVAVQGHGCHPKGWAVRGLGAPHSGWLGGGWGLRGGSGGACTEQQAVGWPVELVPKQIDPAGSNGGLRLS
jgi:hypothetical protein